MEPCAVLLQPTIFGTLLEYVVAFPCPCHFEENPITKLHLISRAFHRALKTEKRLIAQVSEAGKLSEAGKPLDETRVARFEKATCCSLRLLPAAEIHSAWKLLPEATRAGLSAILRRRFAKHLSETRAVREDQIAIETLFIETGMLDTEQPGPALIQHYRICQSYLAKAIDLQAITAHITSGAVMPQHFFRYPPGIADSAPPKYIFDIDSLICGQDAAEVVAMFVELQKRRDVGAGPLPPVTDYKWGTSDDHGAYFQTLKPFALHWTDRFEPGTRCAILEALADGSLRSSSIGPACYLLQDAKDLLAHLETHPEPYRDRSIRAFVTFFRRNIRPLSDGLLEQVKKACVEVVLTETEKARLERFTRKRKRGGL